MDFRLHHQGTDLGTFPLDELRRRRQAGLLQGTELVWGEGMDQWRTLDAVLEQRPSTPPPFRGPASPPSQPGILFWAIGSVALIAVAAALFVCGRAMVRFKRQLPVSRIQGPEDAARALAGKPIVWTPATLTQRQVRKRGGEFRTRQWLEGYRQRGHRDPASDADAVRFLELWIAKNYGESSFTNDVALESLGDQLYANPSCDDAALLTAIAVNTTEPHGYRPRLERAYKQFSQSRHLAYPRFYATVSFANSLGSDRGRVAPLDSSALSLFSEAFADGSFQSGDQAEIAEILVADWGSAFFKRNAAEILPTARAAGKSFEWLALVLEGNYEVDEAWKARGSGFAQTVSQQGWEGFSSHLAAARRSLTKAWQLRPDLPLAPSTMIRVAMGDAGAAEMRLWFDRAVVAQIDHPAAWSNLFWGLRPRWHGSLGALLALGEAGLRTKRFDTDVPRKFFEAVGQVEAEIGKPAGQHIYERADIWPRLQEMYEGYLAEPSRPEQRDDWRMSYTIVAYFAKQYGVARRQLEQLDWKIAPALATSWRVDSDLLPLEIAARTSSAGPEIDVGERLRQRKNVSEALRHYSRLDAASIVDERTRKFLQSRLATLAIEQRLQAGESVDWLPRSDTDPNWILVRGEWHCLPDGAVEVTAGRDGHFLYSRVRVGPNFELKGDFEMVRCSRGRYQGGLVMGTPNLAEYDWYAFRMTHMAGGDLASFSRAWTSQQIRQPVKLAPGPNSFELRLQDDSVTASVNGTEIFHEAKPPRTIASPGKDFLIGLGVSNDNDETVIRYRHLQVRRLPPSDSPAQ